jgi:LysR family transcriptional regulator, low CO2-responsive transcriptional regulator
VSLQVKQLERTLGIDLFEQIGKKIYLTEPGRVLEQYSQKLTALIDETMLVMDEMKGVMRGKVTVVADTTAGIYVVPQAIGAFHRLHPTLQLSLELQGRTGAQEALLTNQADLAIIARVPDSLTFVIQDFIPNELVLIASPTHRLAGGEHVPLHELTGESVILREVGSMTREVAERFFRDRDIDVNFGMALGSSGAIKQAVAADLGIAVLSKQAITLELAMGRLVTLKVEGFPIMRKWFLVHLKEKRLSSAAAALKQFLWEYRLQQAPNLVT